MIGFSYPLQGKAFEKCNLVSNRVIPDINQKTADKADCRLIECRFNLVKHIPILYLTTSGEDCQIRSVLV